MEKALKSKDFEQCFERNLSKYVKDRIKEYNFIHDVLSKEEQGEYLDWIVIAIAEGLPKVGEHRKNEWEKGWLENILSGDTIPRYFGKHDVLRWKQTFIKPISNNYEVNMLHLIVDWLADKYMRTIPVICEFGCGTGHNIPHVRKVNPNAVIWGLDWVDASQSLVERIALKTSDSRVIDAKFNFFEPDYDFDYVKDACIYTVAALEQTGKDFGKFLDYLLFYKPEICVHIEPIGELLDSTDVFDFTSIKYFEKRGYLSGFLTRLQKLEEEKRVEIILSQRTFIGSLFIEGYSVIVWKPI